MAAFNWTQLVPQVVETMDPEGPLGPKGITFAAIFGFTSF